jgi:maleate cis-trans isomerase
MSDAKPEKLVAALKPTSREQDSGSHDALRELLPPGIRIQSFYCGISEGTTEEFKAVMPQYERAVAEAAALKPDMIHPEGTPPFMLHGFAGEARIVRGWEDKYGVPVFTSGQNQIRALKALGARRFVGAGYDSITGPLVETYFRDAGFDVLAIEKTAVEWLAAGNLTDDEMVAMMVGVFRRHPGGQAMYLQGSKWPSLRVIERLETAIDVPVVQAVAARCWEIQVRCKMRVPVKGYGRLLATMPVG